MKHHDMQFSTKAIHAGGDEKNPKNALNAPIYMTSTFVFDNVDHVDKVMSFESDDYVYTRGNNPTLRMLEERVAALEGGVASVAFASGMAAISSVLFSLVEPGDNIIVHKTLYGSTHTVATKLLPKYGVQCKVIDLSDLEAVKAAVDSRTKAIYFETPCNPTLQILDIRGIVSASASSSKADGVKIVVDNTFASPYLQRPLELGADVVVHSATKYLGGHGDIVAGIAIANDLDYIMRLKFDYMCEFGGVMSPFNAWLILRGIKTLSIRMDRHVQNAMAVAKFLENHDAVEKVCYPGLESFDGHELAKRQMDGFGAIISFEIKGDLMAARRLVDATKLAKLAVSLGDCETLIEVPAAMTHRGYDHARLSEFGLTESMVRISVGIEDVADIISDLEQALATLSV